MYYDLAKKELKYIDCFVNEEASFFVNALNDTELKRLNIAKVIELPKPEIDTNTHILEDKSYFDEQKHAFFIKYEAKAKSEIELKELLKTLINQKRDETQLIIRFKNKSFLNDANFRMLLTSFINSSLEEFMLLSAENEFITLSKKEVIELLNLCLEQNQSHIFNARKQKDSLESLSTLELINLYKDIK